MEGSKNAMYTQAGRSSDRPAESAPPVPERLYSPVEKRAEYIDNEDGGLSAPYAAAPARNKSSGEQSAKTGISQKMAPHQNKYVVKQSVKSPVSQSKTVIRQSAKTAPPQSALKAPGFMEDTAKYVVKNAQKYIPETIARYGDQNYISAPAAFSPPKRHSVEIDEMEFLTRIPEKLCGHCGAVVAPAAKICGHCGKEITVHRHHEHTCGHCGAVVAPTAKTCGHCGKEVTVHRHEHTCNHCGAAVAPTAKICGHCGKEITVHRHEHTCNHCGAAVAPAAKICGHCGKEITVLEKDVKVFELKRGAPPVIQHEHTHHFQNPSRGVEVNIKQSCSQRYDDGFFDPCHHEDVACDIIQICSPIAMLCVKAQDFDDLYENEQGFSRGTIFSELDKPFTGEGI